VPGDDKAKRKALDLLIGEYVTVEKDGNAHRHYSLKPYRDDEALPHAA
jgi:hypothetical protein